MSTVVARGRGSGIVVRVGQTTEIGKISSAIADVENKTPIQKNLAKLSMWLVAVAIVLCAAVVIVQVGWNTTRPQDAKWSIVDIVKTGISLAVSVIPEGLVAVTTVTMAVGVRRMAARSAIVRTLPSVETIGGVNYICSDKTGTLTEGNMAAHMLWCTYGPTFIFSGTDPDDATKGQISEIGDFSGAIGGDEAIPGVTVELASDRPIDVYARRQFVTSLLVCALCNNASMTRDDHGKWTVGGDTTETALLIAAARAKLAKESWFASEEYQLTRYSERAFDSDRKLMSVAFSVEPKVDSSKYLLVVAKGAAEELLLKCTHYMGPSGSGQSDSGRTERADDALSQLGLHDICPIDETVASHITEHASAMARNGLRVLGLAVKRQSDLDPMNSPSIWSPEHDSHDARNSHWSENSLVFVGLIGLIDPPKAGVADAVAKCKKAGIRVIMITGDHVDTAIAIASQLGIYDNKNPDMHWSLKGAELDLLNDDMLSSLSPFPSVFARVSPDNKLRLYAFFNHRASSSR